MATLKLLVEVELDDEGRIRSTHRPLSAEDQAVMDGWPSGGLVHVAHALFIEALRRESYTMALSALSTGTPPEELTAKSIEDLTRAQYMKMLDQFAGPASEGTLKIVRPD